MSNSDIAKRVIETNSKVLYGIFGVIESSGYFPPRPFLNEFLAVGHDPCDQDGRMAPWQPFALTAAEYDAVKTWWFSSHPSSVESQLGVQCWSDWVQEILEP